ncbi:hypothetical protein OSB04_020868 [Centaurea solstitialis]|uniref:Ribosomal protein/NADH dehydrogenase domain-containing protein n=1 Tax=Centaurea solstitialis TaxID=347529 RepID=A0AA38ST41_9ASTR|nr:hypothetical protein OSB04_020868 [Centaurea solstitialis]
MASSTKILHEFPFFIRVYEDGRVERFLKAPRVPPSTDPVSGVRTKDVIVSSDLEVKSRIFLPKTDPTNPPRKLPLIIYVHGGGYCTGSPLNALTHGFLAPLVSQTPAVAVAVGYRLAPEHPLPAAYDDCWAAFKWIDSHAHGSGPDPWLNEYVDTARVFLIGESVGANLAHYLAVQAGVNKTGLGIRGLIAIHPYFSQKEPDKMLKYLYPTSSGSDDEAKLNPRSDPDLEKMGCTNVLVIVAEKDYLRPRGMDYVETLKMSKWGGRLEFMENKGEDHCFHLFNTSSEKAKSLTQDLISYMNQKLMAWRGQLSKNLKELRVLFCQTSEASSSTRSFVEKNYKELKKANPKLPILIRECSGTEPQLWARYDMGVERGIRLEGMTEAQISKALEDLVKS